VGDQPGDGQIRRGQRAQPEHLWRQVAIGGDHQHHMAAGRTDAQLNPLVVLAQQRGGGWTQVQRADRQARIFAQPAQHATAHI